MRCLRCPATAEGFAVAPGVGDAGEVRFYCDACARRDRAKMRYWDGRDLDVGGHRDEPDLGDHFQTLIFGMSDLARMRTEDLATLLEWLDDLEIAVAAAGMSVRFQERVFAALKGGRGAAVRQILRDSAALQEADPKEIERRIVQTVVKL